MTWNRMCRRCGTGPLVSEKVGMRDGIPVARRHGGRGLDMSCYQFLWKNDRAALRTYPPLTNCWSDIVPRALELRAKWEFDGKNIYGPRTWAKIAADLGVTEQSLQHALDAHGRPDVGYSQEPPPIRLTRTRLG